MSDAGDMTPVQEMLNIIAKYRLADNYVVGTRRYAVGYMKNSFTEAKSMYDALRESLPPFVRVNIRAEEDAWFVHCDYYAWVNIDFAVQQTINAGDLPLNLPVHPDDRVAFQKAIDSNLFAVSVADDGTLDVTMRRRL